MTDTNGRVLRNIFRGQVDRPGYTHETDITGMAKGVYMIRLTLNGRAYVRKFVY
jgi:hypothetical protein